MKAKEAQYLMDSYIKSEYGAKLKDLMVRLGVIKLDGSLSNDSINKLEVGRAHGTCHSRGECRCG